MGDLADWMKTFLKNRDVFDRSITSIEDVAGGFVVHKQSGDVFVLIRPQFDDIDEVVSREGPCALVVLNSKKNFAALLKAWGVLSAKKNLCVYFVNPKTSEKWLVYPYTHSQITEKSALEKGLQSLFDTVASVD